MDVKSVLGKTERTGDYVQVNTVSGRIHRKDILDRRLHRCDPVIWGLINRNDASFPVFSSGHHGNNFFWTSSLEEWLTNNFLCFILRHFLFKTSSGTTPLFSSSSPGYPLTSGTVYSPPPRLLPRNTFSRSAFKLKKPSKYCSWKCAAVTAIAAAALLAVLLSYFIGKWNFIPGGGLVKGSFNPRWH